MYFYTVKYVQRWTHAKYQIEFIQITNANPQYILYQANVSSIEYQRMMSVYKKAVRQTEQIRWKIQIQKYKIRSEYTEFNTYKMIENMFTATSRTGELGAFAKENVTTTSIKKSYSKLWQYVSKLWKCSRQAVAKQ